MSSLIKDIYMNSLVECIYKARCGENWGKKPLNSLRLLRTSILYEEGMAIYNFIREMKPANTLEIGMACGLSTLFICQAHRDNGGAIIQP